MFPGGPSSSLRVAFLAVSWGVLGLYGFSMLWWLYETTVLARGWRVDEDDIQWGFDDVQVRVLTVDAASVVQATVDAIPDAIADVHVVAEAAMSIDGATVHVVPDEFECAATNKGRAVEWARRNVPCEREYVLYLDGDTLVTGFTGLPDADVIQFTEKPLYTGSNWPTSRRCSALGISSNSSDSTGSASRCTRGVAASRFGVLSRSQSPGTSRRSPKTRTSSGERQTLGTSVFACSTPDSEIRHRPRCRR